MLVATAARVFGGYDPNSAPDRATDELVYRLSSRYGLELPRSMLSQPLRSGELASFLAQADSLAAVGVLTRQEAAYVEQLTRTVTGSRALLRWAAKEKSIENVLNLSLLGEVAPSYHEEPAARLKGIIRPSLSGSIRNLSYFSAIDVSTEYRSDTLFRPTGYQPYNGVPFNLYGRADSSHVRSSDIFRGGVSFSGSLLHIETAVDYVRSGPAVHYPLTFSGTAPPLTYLRARLDLGAADYVHTFGLLRSQKDKAKYFYTHRLHIPAFGGRLAVGINEVVVTGSTTDEQGPSDTVNGVQSPYRIEERGWEWVYMIPFVPYAFAEHYVGDRDNVVLSFDVSVAAPRNFRWYFEFFLDDMTTPLTIFSDDWGNKWALTLGGQYFGVLKGRDISATLEYSRIEPWVYTHFGGGSHRYTHFGQSLGAPMGPNADGLTAQCTYAVHHLHTLGLLAKVERKDLLSRGGSVRHVFQAGVDSESKKFLGGPLIELRRMGGVTWRMNPFGLFRVDAIAYYELGKGPGFEASGGFSF